MSSISRIQLEAWLKTIEVSGKVLDCGGSQNPIKGRTKSWEAEDYKILDLETPHITKQKPDIIADIQGGIPVGYVEYFDVAFCIEVSEYWISPMSALLNICHKLKKDGILYISFHSLYGLHNPKGEDCLRYTKNAIYKLAEATGFEIEDIETKKLDHEGRNLYYRFCHSQGMRLDYQDEQTYDQGYLVKMKRL